MIQQEIFLAGQSTFIHSGRKAINPGVWGEAPMLFFRRPAEATFCDDIFF
jgi:hypothetical protein